MSEMVTIWATKYALTSGVAKYDARISDHMAIVREPGSLTMFFHGEGKEWHRTRDSAIHRAEEMRLDKIKSLERQLEKLKKLSFGLTP